MKQVFSVLLLFCLLGTLCACTDNTTILPARDSVTLSFITGNTGRIDPLTFEKGDAITLPPAPVKPGYTFVGWFTQPDGNGTEVSEGDIITESMTLYAYRTQISVYTVTLTDAIGTTRSYTLRGDETLTLPEADKVDGWFFRGWFTREMGKGEQVETVRSHGTDLVLYAFREIDQSVNPVELHTVTFDLQGGTGDAQPCGGIPVGGCIPSFPEPVNDIFILAGWYTEPNGKGKLYTKDTSVYNDLTLYAFWKLPVYTVEFDLNGGQAETTDPYSVTHGECVSLFTPTREGFDFLGWYDLSVPGEEVLFTSSTPVTGNILLTAQWKSSQSYRPVTSSGTDPVTPVSSEAKEPEPVRSDAPETPVASDGQ